jgi:hypothetical protein
MGAWSGVYVAVGRIVLCTTPASSPVHAAVRWDLEQAASGAWAGNALRATMSAHGPSLVLLCFVWLYCLGFPFSTSMLAPAVCLACTHVGGAACAALRWVHGELVAADGGGAGGDTAAQLAQHHGDMQGASQLLMLLCVVAAQAHEEMVVPRAVRLRYETWLLLATRECAERPAAEAAAGDEKAVAVSR